MRRFLASIFVLFVPVISHADISSRLNIATIDNSTCNTYPFRLIFPNANCTDNGNGTVSISITGGSGGSSSLAMGLGSSSTFVTQITSPTQPISLDISQFSGLAIGTTGFFSIAYATNSQTASYTATSTDTVVEANCGSACTVTLPTAIGRSGKVYFIKILGAGTTTIATVASQTIDGSSTIVPNPNQFVEIEVLSNGSNWEIL